LNYEELAKNYAQNATNLASSLINPAIDTLDSVSGSLKNLTEISSLQDQIKSTNNSLNTLSDLNNSEKQISDLNSNVASFMIQEYSANNIKYSNCIIQFYFGMNEA
jgi:hypothetical protein